MYVDRKRSARALTLLLGLEVAIFAWFFVAGRSLGDDQWALLEARRPSHRPPGDMSICADCLDFALARRALGGWNTLPGHILELTNIPAVFAARGAFERFQAASDGTSRSHSDKATAVFVAAAVAECLIGGIVLGIRVGQAPRAG